MHTEGKLTHAESSKVICAKQGDAIQQVFFVASLQQSRYDKRIDLIEQANAERLAACWNAFEGVSTEDAEKLDVGRLLRAITAYYAQQCGDYSKKPCNHAFFCVCPGDELRAALAGIGEEGEAS